MLEKRQQQPAAISGSARDLASDATLETTKRSKVPAQSVEKKSKTQKTATKKMKKSKEEEKVVAEPPVVRAAPSLKAAPPTPTEEGEPVIKIALFENPELLARLKPTKNSKTVPERKKSSP